MGKHTTAFKINIYIYIYHVKENLLQIMFLVKETVNTIKDYGMVVTGAIHVRSQ